MIRWRARAHQQSDFALLLACQTKRGNSGTRRSPEGRDRLAGQRRWTRRSSAGRAGAAGRPGSGQEKVLTGIAAEVRELKGIGCCRMAVLTDGSAGSLCPF